MFEHVPFVLALQGCTLLEFDHKRITFVCVKYYRMYFVYALEWIHCNSWIWGLCTTTTSSTTPTTQNNNTFASTTSIPYSVCSRSVRCRSLSWSRIVVMYSTFWLSYISCYLWGVSGSCCVWNGSWLLVSMLAWSSWHPLASRRSWGVFPSLH